MTLVNGIALDWGARSTDAFLDQAALLRDSGYSMLWMSNNRFEQDVWIAATALAHSAAYGHVGTFVADPYTQHPALLAAAIATLDLVAPKTPILGLGAGGTGFREMGLHRLRPAARLEAAAIAIRQLLAGDKVSSSGEFVCADAQLGFRPSRSIPIFIGTRGDRVLEAAGRAADGVMISTYAQPAGFRRAMNIVRRAAHEVGREAALQVFARIDVGLPPSELEVKQALATSIVTSYPDTQFLRVANVEVADAVLEAAEAGDIARARGVAADLGDDILEQFAWIGGETELAARAQAIADLGIDGVIVVPHGRTPDEVVDCMLTCARALQRVVGTKVDHGPGSTSSLVRDDG